MKIDGKAIADGILDDLCTQINVLKDQEITPTLVVILVGDNPASLSYIKQKQKAATTIGATLLLNQQPPTINKQQLQEIIEKYSVDPNIHGLIIQRPLPPQLTSMYQYIKVSKDVDGFSPFSPHPVPVAAAVLKILDNRIQTKKVVVLGRGETAGKPIAEALIKRGCNVTIVHSQTSNPDNAIRTADIVISCVGKPNVVRRDNIKTGAFLVSVGIWRDSEGKLHGDYEEDEIKDVASFYTPTPGGVGPVNVACLMDNLYRSCLPSR